MSSIARNTPIRPDNLELALRLAAVCGWYVFPANRANKRPMIDPETHKPIAWSQKSTTDALTIYSWWHDWPEALIGVDCKKSGLLCVDLDVKHPPANGIETWRAWFPTEEHAALRQDTPTGGKHKIFSQPPGSNIPNGTSIAPGVDVRSAGKILPNGETGAGGYFCTGGNYTWETSPLEFMTPEPPQALIDRIAFVATQPKSTRKSPQAAAPPGAACDYFLSKYLTMASLGNRNRAGYALAQQLHWSGVSKTDAEETLRAYAARVPQTAHDYYAESEALTSLESAWRGEMREPAHIPQARAAFERQASPPALEDFPLEPLYTGELEPEEPVTILEILDTPQQQEEPNAEEKITRFIGGLMSADELLTTEWPELVWIVPDLLPAGLTILAGAPKIGKSWFALQIALSVASGGVVFGQRVERGRVLYLALEDSPRRLAERMKMLKWPVGLEADFMTVGSFYDRIGDLRNGGGERLGKQIESRNYRFVVIDTLSRAIRGDQNEVHEMTEWLDPLQRMAQSNNFGLVLVDHHRKSNGFEVDAVNDLLGSVGKSAVPDTILGLYRQRNQRGARLAVTGRETEERTIDLAFDKSTACWQADTTTTGETLPPQQAEILRAVEQIGPAGPAEIARAVGLDRGAVYPQLVALEKKSLVVCNDKKWEIV